MFDTRNRKKLGKIQARYDTQYHRVINIQEEIKKCKSVSRVLLQCYLRTNRMQQLLLPFISILVHTKTPSIYPPRNSFPKKRNRTSSSLPEVYLIFQPIRFALPSTSLRRRWALTPPFHPFLW